MRKCAIERSCSCPQDIHRERIVKWEKKEGRSRRGSSEFESSSPSPPVTIIQFAFLQKFQQSWISLCRLEETITRVSRSCSFYQFPFYVRLQASIVQRFNYDFLIFLRCIPTKLQGNEATDVKEPTNLRVRFACRRGIRITPTGITP